MFSQLTVKFKKPMSFIHINVQSVTKKRMQLNSIVSEMGENAIFGIYETGLTLDDDLCLRNIASSTHELYRCDRRRNKE